MPQITNVLLLQATLDAPTLPTFAQRFSEFCTQSAVPMRAHRIAWSQELSTVYAYAQLDTATPLPASGLPAMATLIQQLCPAAQQVRLSRLELVFSRAGASQHEKAAFHYIVQTDADEGWMPEIARWYDTEHMPGLAAVPGCINAKRLLNHDHDAQRPYSFACYDLTHPETLASAPWLAVRHTAWSDVARPHFANTQRTMFEVIG